MEFPRLQRLPPYVLSAVADLMKEARRKGEDIINLGMGNPDIPTPKPVVEKLIEAAQKPVNHRYSLSRGIPKLREAITAWYKRHYAIELDPEKEAIVTLGAKEGLSHLVLAMTSPGDVVLVPNPTYPIHAYSVVIAGADARGVQIGNGVDFFENLKRAVKTTWPNAKLLILSFPSNPTTQVVELSFFEKLVAFAKDNDLKIIHDLAYADIVFDGYKAPSILEVPDARSIAVEFYSMSKGYSMPGWRVGFCVGNKDMVAALAKIKSYLDYGMFQPIQIAATVALNKLGNEVKRIADIYRGRRDVLCNGLSKMGWETEKPLATMFVWARIPEKFASMGSVEFAKLLLKKGKVAVSPGAGFGEFGEGFIRFALVENEARIRQALRGIRPLL
jgi:alanine-synthesizing transaminase